MSDSELLRRFVAENSQEAFAELVRRRIDLVYSAALRQLAGDQHRAKDVMQEVFVALARKARTLATHPDLLGWLFTSTHFAALQAIRTEQRRRKREHESHLMHDTPALGRDHPEWERVQPLLDLAMHELPARDRQVVLLRFFDRKPFAAIGEILGLSENAAQKSAERALEKLQAALARRGVTSTGAALGAALAGNIVTAAPAGLVTAVTQTALAGAATSLAGSSVGGLSLLMSSTKITIAAAVGIAAIATGLVLRERNAATESGHHARVAETAATTARAEIVELRTRLAASEKRAVSAENDNAILLQAISDSRTTQKPPPAAPQPAPPITPLPSRDAILAQLTANIEKMEARARAMPGYRPYQEPDEARLAPEQRVNLAQRRERARAKNGYLFASFDFPGMIYEQGPNYDSEEVRKLLPQLTPEDRKALDERQARASAETAFAKTIAAEMAKGAPTAK